MTQSEPKTKENAITHSMFASGMFSPFRQDVKEGLTVEYLLYVYVDNVRQTTQDQQALQTLLGMVTVF
jgi:hypothetical protein